MRRGGWHPFRRQTVLPITSSSGSLLVNRNVSRAADTLVGSQTEDACRLTTLPYGDSVRTIQVDMVAFDSADQKIRVYEVKRGFGQFDAGKIRSIKRDLMCVQVLLIATAKILPS
jgi:hypothetical protein